MKDINKMSFKEIEQELMLSLVSADFTSFL